METIGSQHPLRRLFAGLVENAFCSEVGMCDPGLTTYVADLLVEFTHIDRLNAIRNASGKRLDQVAAMLAVASPDEPTSTVERDRRLYKHIGDYTLFWAGMYPEQLRRANCDCSDSLDEYVTQGKRSYAIVSELVDESASLPPSLFRQLSVEFEYCLHGLGLVRQGWERSRASAAGGGDLLA